MQTAHDITQGLRTKDVFNEENVNVDFASLLLSEPVLDGLNKAGFRRPSPIQLKAIPLGRCGLDLIIQAKSGTGKTCVFTVIALEGIELSNNATQVLILAPTREIAVQIQAVIQDIGSAMAKLRCHVFIGGTLIGPDKQNLKKCHIAVGTPGRIKQLIETGMLNPASIRLFILDEADKLMDDKFQTQINWIYNHLPYNKQMLAASATYPDHLAHHLTSYMRDAMFVRLNTKQIALHGIHQYFQLVKSHELPHKAFTIKVNHLLGLLSSVAFQQCLVFSNLHTRAENLCDILCLKGWPSVFISGGLEQKQRLHAMSLLKKFQCRVLISTDLTARGIDAEKVNLVVNLDVPIDVKTYMHRIGRAGRFGTHGAAVTLASFGREEVLLQSIQKESHSQMHLLPDPIPSDLLSPNFEYDKTNWKDITNANIEEGISLGQNNMEAMVDSTEYRSPKPHIIQRNSHLVSSSVSASTADSDIVVSADLFYKHKNSEKVVMVDKGCQVNIDPNSVFNLVGAVIPSFANSVKSRRSHTVWSFQDSLKDFQDFKKSGQLDTESVNESQNGNCKNCIDDDDVKPPKNVLNGQHTVCNTNTTNDDTDNRNVLSHPCDRKKEFISHNLKDSDEQLTIIENVHPQNQEIDGNLKEKKIIERIDEMETERTEMSVNRDECEAGCELIDGMHHTEALMYEKEITILDREEIMQLVEPDRWTGDERGDKVLRDGTIHYATGNVERKLIRGSKRKDVNIFTNGKSELMNSSSLDHNGDGDSSASDDGSDGDSSASDDGSDGDSSASDDGSDGDSSSSSDDCSDGSLSSSLSKEEYETECDTSQSCDEKDEEPSTSRLFIVKDGVVVQVNPNNTSNGQIDTRKVTEKRDAFMSQVQDTSEDDCEEGSDGRDVDEEQVKSMKENTKKQSKLKGSDGSQTNSYYGHSSYPEYYHNRSTKRSDNPQTIGHYQGYQTAYNHGGMGGWYNMNGWQYPAAVVYSTWPIYPVGIVPFTVPNTPAAEWYPYGY